MTEGIENIIHNILEFTRGIFETKRHNIPLIMTKRNGKSSFILIVLTNLDLQKPDSYQTWRTPQHHSIYELSNSYRG